MRQRQQAGDIGITERNSIAGQIDAGEPAGLVEIECAAQFRNMAYRGDELGFRSGGFFAGQNRRDLRLLAGRRRRLAGAREKPRAQDDEPRARAISRSAFRRTPGQKSLTCCSAQGFPVRNAAGKPARYTVVLDIPSRKLNSYSVHGARSSRCIIFAASSSPTMVVVFGSQVILRWVRTAMLHNWLMVSLRTA